MQLINSAFEMASIVKDETILRGSWNVVYLVQHYECSIIILAGQDISDNIIDTIRVFICSLRYYFSCSPPDDTIRFLKFEYT